MQKMQLRRVQMRQLI